MTEVFLNQKKGSDIQNDQFQRQNIIMYGYPYFLILNIAIGINKAYSYKF